MDREAEVGARRVVEAAFAADHGRILAILIRDLGDFDLAEEALQEAFAEAVRTWPSRGTPSEPAGWILATARNRAIDRIRRIDSRQKAVERMVRSEDHDDPVVESLLADEDIPDERLRLIFTCCHPALARQDAVALTLRTVGGLRTREIASSFLVKETTMQARITRAKAKIRAARIPYRVPDHHELPERLTPVLDVVMLVYNQGYTPVAEEPVIDSLRAEAITMAEILSRHLPDEPEVLGCLALLLFHESRSPARVDANGELVALEDQDRTTWDDQMAARADRVLDRALRLGRPGPIQIQAAISGVHSASSSAEETDWDQIVILYDELVRVAPSPTTEVARAVAVGMAQGPTVGLAALPEPVPPLDTFHRWHAARGELLRRAGLLVEAGEAMGRAASLASNLAEQRWLIDARRRCLDELSAGRRGDAP